MKCKHITLTITVYFLSFSLCNAQLKKENFKLGISFGQGSHNKFPFKQNDYIHEVTFYKVQINYQVLKKENWSYEVSVEPSYNIAEHQLLNKYFIKPTDGDDYQQKQALFTQKREINEYVLNVGFLVRYHVLKPISVYAIGSIGPMISDKETERLAKGFAFSDVFGLGISTSIYNTQFDVRYSVRHTSNLQLKKPNNGHNTTNIEFIVLFKL